MSEQQQGMWTLRIVHGPVPGRTFAIVRPTVTLGRDAANDVVIDDPTVSRRHAQLAFQDGTFYVTDLGSANGVTVNGIRITGPRRVEPGEQIALSDSLVLVLEWVPRTQETMVTRPDTGVTMPSGAPPGQGYGFPPPPAQPSAAGGTAMGLLFAGCGIVLFVFAVVGVVAALMFTGVLPNPFATPTATPQPAIATATATQAPPSVAPSATPTSPSTPTPYPTYTAYPTYTPFPTDTPLPTATELPSSTPTVTQPPPTATATATQASVPTSTPTATQTPRPTATQTQAPTPTPTGPLTISWSLESIACISKAQYKMVFDFVLSGGTTGTYKVYRDNDEQIIFGPSTDTAFTYELTWGAGSSAVGTFYVMSGGERAESKFYVETPDCTGF